MTYSFISKPRIDEQQDRTTYMVEGSTTGRVTSHCLDERKTSLPVNRSDSDFTCINTRKMVVV